MSTLKSNSTLQGGKYVITKSLGQGGFGVTYLALQTGLERKVAIKEFFMKEFCERDEATSHVTMGTKGSHDIVNRFREKFLKEARNIAKLNHPNIVRVIDVFEENGTAYYVMEYAENGSLADKVKREGYLSEPVATRYILQVAEALDYIHQRKINHLDVKPANIMLNENDESILIDFGLSKQYDESGSQTSTTPVGISEGYAPMEQYMQGGVGAFSPETDIYSLGATYYKLLTGATPPNASFVQNEGLPLDELKAKGVSDKAICVITMAMEGLKKNRMKSIHAFIDGLKAGTTPASTPQSVVDDDATVVADAKPAAKSSKQSIKPNASVVDEEATVLGDNTFSNANDTRKSSNKKKLYAIVAGVVAVVAIAVGAFFMFGSSRSSEVLSFDVKGQKFDMMLVKAGTFTMGSSSEKPDTLESWEGTPAHQVTLTKDYYIGKTEVTQGLWKAVMGSNPSSFWGDNKPVESVSWDDCQEFIKKLNALTGKTFRLPTEAEWEFAARGGNNSKHTEYSGSNDINAVAWYSGNAYGKGEGSPDYGTRDVATKSPNELGIYDMTGNVWEWCNDWYEEYKDGAQTDPKGPNSGSYRVFRGGSWRDFFAWHCRVWRRNCTLGDHYEGLGFRLALSE